MISEVPDPMDSTTGTRWKDEDEPRTLIRELLRQHHSTTTKIAKALAWLGGVLIVSGGVVIQMATGEADDAGWMAYLLGLVALVGAGVSAAIGAGVALVSRYCELSADEADQRYRRLADRMDDVITWERTTADWLADELGHRRRGRSS